MILQVLKKEGKYRVVLPEMGKETFYDAILEVCDSPICSCGVVEMTLTPVSVDGEPIRQAPTRCLPIDVIGRRLGDMSRKKYAGQDRDFAKSFIKQMDDEDFQFLYIRYIAAKKYQTDKAAPHEIEAIFEFDKIEEKGLLTTYNDILPYADQLVVEINGAKCLVFDQYCLRNGCDCTETHLNLQLINDKQVADREIGGYFVDYSKKTWKTPKELVCKKGYIDLATARRCIEEQNPTIYEVMKERHGRLTKIYNHRYQQQSSPDNRPAQGLNIGRNEPCPCGSGKKYKKCCLGK
ncbi:MAG: hypothetical protein A2511_07860 [Deltaproteobacteria bacterium RIFOXYD12_FULL_50_9]|nr:MAG: hypothetical protein A2511_07860 [Deltaproteobacteria bacterium RIFOXYD12_FULL_50_9]